jgi:hypothetical protein
MAFRNACNKFILTEVLRNDPTTQPDAQENQSVNKKKESKDTLEEIGTSTPELPKNFILTALEQSTDDTGWAQLGTFGSYLTKLQSDFDSRIYGYRKLSDLVKARKDLFLTEERKAPGGEQKVLYVRSK